MRVVIFGTGRFYLNRQNTFEGIDIVAFLDNDREKHGTWLNGVQIHNPKDVTRITFDYACIMVASDRDVLHDQLVGLGVKKRQILTYEELLNIVEENNGYSKTVNYYPILNQLNNTNKGSHILMMVHELSLSGAPMVMFYAAKVLKKNGFRLNFFSLKDGRLKENILEEGISVTVKEHINKYDDVFFEWVEQFDGLFICTLLFGGFLRNAKRLKNPIIWWIHESNETYTAWWERSNPGKEMLDRLDIYNGGVRPLEAYQQFSGRDDGKILLYGVSDIAPAEKKEKTEEKLTFALVATVQPRKGQDIFVDAILSLDSDEYNLCEFWLVGPTPNVWMEYEKKYHDKAKGKEHIKFIDECDTERLYQMYEEMDVLVCPSRDDPLPVVLIEAMMFSTPCIVSTGAGTAKYIDDKENGVICEPTVESVTEALRWMIHHRMQLSDMGKKSRKIYEDVFSEQTFEKNILGIMKKHGLTGEAG